MNNFKNAFFLLFSITITSCVSLNSHQTGRTVGKGNHQAYGAFNFGKLNSEFYWLPIDDRSFYLLEVGDFHGISERFDIGGEINTSNQLSVIGKYQFLGNKESLWASSAGLELGGGIFTWMSALFTYHTSVTLYNSMHLTESIALTFSPRYIFLGWSTPIKMDDNDETTKINNITGFSTGFIIGKKQQFSFEYSRFINHNEPVFGGEQQFSVGYIIKLNKSEF